MMKKSFVINKTMDKNNNSNITGNGFLMGVIVGAVGTLLFTTKKGREIVREITDKGLEKFSDFEIALEDNAQELEGIESGDYIDSTEPIVIGKLKLTKQEKPEKVNIPKNSKMEASKTKVKRYFRLKKN